MIAVCLLTCDRQELTARTVASFVAHNRGRTDLELLFCDGGSQTPENCRIAGAAGFKPVYVAPPEHRVGQMTTLRQFLKVTGEHEWILWLENDWESVAPVPTFEWLDNCGVETVRLFGARKMRSGPRALAGEHRIGTKELIDWQSLVDLPGWEHARAAHWGAGGTLIRRCRLTRFAHLPRLKDVITADPRLLSLRPVENIMWSIGETTTEGFLG